MIVSVVRIVSVASNFWDDYMETLSGTTETILTTETTQSSETWVLSLRQRRSDRRLGRLYFLMETTSDDPYDRIYPIMLLGIIPWCSLSYRWNDRNDHMETSWSPLSLLSSQSLEIFLKRQRRSLRQRRSYGNQALGKCLNVEWCENKSGYSRSNEIGCKYGYSSPSLAVTSVNVV